MNGAGTGDGFIHNRTTFSEKGDSGDPVLPWDVVDGDFDYYYYYTAEFFGSRAKTSLG